MNALIFILLLLCFFAIGYTSGNFLYAEIISKKFCKTSLYDVGSKNPGSTNLARQTKSKKIILFAFSLDVLKCYIPILLAAFIYRIIIKNTDLNLYTPCIIYFAAIGALIGHCYPIKYLYTILFKGGFKSPLVVHNHGGRGVACMAGIFLALNPFFWIVGLSIWIFIKKGLKMVSLASIITVFVGPFFILIPYFNSCLYMIQIANGIPPSPLWINFVFNNCDSLTFYSNKDTWILFSMMFFSISIVILRHSDNIKRMIKGSELKFNKK